jgi:predicted trehalose synthase
MTEQEQAMFEALAQQLCTSIDRLTATVSEGTRCLEGALGSLESEVMQIGQELQDMHTSLLELQQLASIKEVLRGMAGGMPL